MTGCHSGVEAQIMKIPHPDVSAIHVFYIANNLLPKIWCQNSAKYFHKQLKL
jgi:hypothetical protein